MMYPTSSHVPIKELLIYSTLTGLLWLASFTFMLPALFFLKGKAVGRFVKAIFGARLYVDLPKTTRLNLEPLRKNLFELLDSRITNYRATQLNILDLSLEFKYNFRFYSPENHQVIVMATSDSETRKSDHLGKIGKLKRKVMLNLVECENFYELLSESCDVVVSTLRLCSVENVEAVFAEVKRILKPDGVFAFMEHVGYPEEQAASVIQRIASPLWRTYFSGCSLNRDIVLKLKKAGFSTISYSTFYPENQIMYVRPTVIGICTR